tara:strand:+ start:486 stop:689 length:204 start_codon:yes stop_codon:yes gene_type:complete
MDEQTKRIRMVAVTKEMHELLKRVAHENCRTMMDQIMYMLIKCGYADSNLKQNRTYNKKQSDSKFSS